MKFISILLVMLLFSVNSFQVSYDSSVNYVSNFDFSYPKLINGNHYVINPTAGAWYEVINKILVGVGIYFSSVWNNGQQICQLYADSNSNIYQYINLDAGYYQLNITWATRGPYLLSSQWSIYWNDALIKFITPVNSSINILTLILIANQGTNKLSLRGECSPGCGVGTGVHLVQLYAQNNIQNGNFETPSTRKGWRILKSAGQWSSYTKEIKIGQGTIFNSVWKTGQVAELDGDQNSQIYQVISIPAGKYHLRFDWGARTGVPLASNEFSVWWNSVRITLITPPDYTIHTFTVDVQASEGNNIVSLKGEGISDGYGVGIDNVKLWRAV